MAELLDVNVWFALSLRSHVHYAPARTYWEQPGARAGFCRITALGLVRLLTNSSILKTAVLDSNAAWRTLQQWVTLSGVQWIAEPAGVDEFLGHWAAALNLRGGDWTDAYLAAFCVAGNHRLVTFDSGFGRFPGLRWLQLAV